MSGQSPLKDMEKCGEYSESGWPASHVQGISICKLQSHADLRVQKWMMMQKWHHALAALIESSGPDKMTIYSSAQELVLSHLQDMCLSKSSTHAPALCLRSLS